MTARKPPVMSWMHPEEGCHFAVGSKVGLRVYRMLAAHESGSSARFDMVNFRPMSHPVSSLAAYPRILDHSSVMAVGSDAGEVSLQLYPLLDTPGGMDIAYASTGVNVYSASGRACRQMAFNAIHGDLLACGFDYKEGSPSLHIYDITRNTDIRQLLGTRSTPWSTHSEAADIQQPQNQQQQPTSSSTFANNYRDECDRIHTSAGVTSLSWVPNSVDDVLVACKKNRSSIRWYDLRMRYAGETVLYVPITNASGSVSETPGTVYDLQFDPFNCYRYMAHDRCGFVNMWDIRWASKPLYSFTLGKNKSILRMEYSPRRSGMIGVLTENSSILDIYSVGEFSDGKIPELKPLDATAFLDDAQMKEHYDDYRSSLISELEPQNVHIWTSHTYAPVSVSDDAEPSSMFLWVPPATSSKTLVRQQLITCSDNGVLYASSLPMSLVADFSSRGDVAVSNNWSKLLGAQPKSDAEMAVLHMQTPELRELVLDKPAKHNNSANAAINGAASTTPQTTGATPAPTSVPLVQLQQIQSGGNGLLARRQQAARQQAANGSEAKVAQLGERIKTMNLGISSGAVTTDMPQTTSSSHIHEYLAADKIKFNPAVEGRVAGDDKVESVLMEDVICQMRQRALRGYGTNAETNARIFNHDQNIRDMWQWVRDADIRRRSGDYNIALGVDASFYGVYNIMKLSKKHLKYIERQKHLTVHLDIHLDQQQRQLNQAAAPVVLQKSKLNGQRRLALLYCGWGLEGNIREQHIRALENANDYSAAAGTSFIYGDHQRCLQSLEKSNSQDQKLLSFMLKAQLSEDNKLIRGFTGERASAPSDMFGCPHLQMIFTYLVTGDWSQVLKNMMRMPLSYRLAVALRYMNDASLMRYIVVAGQTAVKKGNLDGIIITGIKDNGRLVLGQYVDNTTDVQTAALVTIFDVEEQLAKSEPSECWIYAYRNLLNRWRMFTTRALFDIALGNNREAKGLSRLSKVAEAIAIKPADARCTFCHQSLSYDVNRWRNPQQLHGGTGLPDASGASGTGAAVAPIGQLPIPGGQGGSPVQASAKIAVGADGRLIHTSKTTQALIGQPGGPVTGGVGMGAEPWRKDPQQMQTRLLYTNCQRCSNRLPRCIICRMTLGTPAVQPSAEDAVAGAGATGSDGEFSQWFSWCQTCGHGGHVSHLKSWFTSHSVCPIPGCGCECEKNY
ncbi:hypothetical protein GGI25_002607 [Coemansia spiralis]|uniref:WD repeat protein mio zinc-ribbon like domain-containing protein n=2 Tax=Coemansia TaxID=4863 RepID=A0A9W8G8M6_9FUNG|nr:hypothetical protein BX070DRAFT_252933 [Coemansia spiralis]KAJ1992235.1 hypothetical protein EDC05_002903 [Coemansia umbellata]KAJ2623349.1 hypothetical protein GGI26_002387 [Coemansia sp. RSA 1358]KAJ2678103.1 hypothetical protein GGI25_002607 [Coemansia spiralis]